MRHLHERCDEHKLDSSSIKKHFTNKHDCLRDNIEQHFKVLKNVTQNTPYSKMAANKLFFCLHVN